MNIINQFASLAENYLSGSGMNPVFPSADSIASLQQLNEPLQEDPVSAEEVLNLLDAKGSPATVKSTGGRYFGFVIGGSLPAAMMAKLLATVWDQNAGLYLMSPVAAHAGRNQQCMDDRYPRFAKTDSCRFCYRGNHGEFYCHSLLPVTNFSKKPVGMQRHRDYFMRLKSR